MTSARAAAGRLHRVPAGGLTLARYGYVEEAPGGRGRQRPWQVVHRSNTIPGDELGADAKLAAGALLQLIRERDLQRLQAYESMRADYPKEWREAAHEMRQLVHLTAAELAELFGAIESVLEPCLEKVERRPGTLPVSFGLHAVPTRLPSDGDPEDRS